MKTENSAASDLPFMVPSGTTPSLLLRTQHAAAALNPTTDIIDAPRDAPPQTSPSSEVPVFKFSLSAGIAVDTADDDDDWKLPTGIPMTVDIPITGSTRKPVANVTLTGAAEGSAPANGSSQTPLPPNAVRPDAAEWSRAGQPSRSQTSPADTPTGLHRTQHARQAPLRNLKVAQLDAQHEPNANYDGTSSIVDMGLMRELRARHSNRWAASQDKQSSDETVPTQAIAARLFSALPGTIETSPEKGLSDQGTRRHAVHYVSDRSAALVAETPPNAESDQGDTYEVTYRFTSWSADAAVKLNLSTSYDGRPVLATPSNPRVHNVLQADLHKGTAAPTGRPEAPPIQLASPLITLVDSDEQGRQNHARRQSLPEEDSR